MVEIQEVTRSKTYQPCLPIWDKHASIRTRPRRILADYDSSCTQFYPSFRQPEVFHPLVFEKGPEKSDKILIHAAYNFMLGIAKVETDCILRFCHKVYNEEINYNFETGMKQDMLSIIIDEAHHAYIALDYIDQIAAHTGVKPLANDKDIELTHCFKKYKNRFEGDEINFFELLVICIGENTLTQELYEMRNGEDVHPFFNEVMADHMFDEGRHSGIFKKMLKHAWTQQPKSIQEQTIRILPEFILDYVSNTLMIASSKKILAAVGFSDDEAQTILDDTYLSMSDKQASIKNNGVVKNIMTLFKQAGLLESDFAKTMFTNAHLL